MVLRDYSGGARAAYLAADIGQGDLLIDTTGLYGWPDGTPGPFFAVINRQRPNEEKILCEFINGNEITVLSRGADDTVAQNHDKNSIIEHIITATDAREANEHVNDAGAHIRVESSEPPENNGEFLPGETWYDTNAKILWILGGDGEWHASTAFPQVEPHEPHPDDIDEEGAQADPTHGLDMKGLRIRDLANPVMDQDAATKAWTEYILPLVAQGPEGPQGPIGPDGPPGEDGEDGADGKTPKVLHQTWSRTVPGDETEFYFDLDPEADAGNGYDPDTAHVHLNGILLQPNTDYTVRVEEDQANPEDYNLIVSLRQPTVDGDVIHVQMLFAFAAVARSERATDYMVNFGGVSGAEISYVDDDQYRELHGDRLFIVLDNN